MERQPDRNDRREKGKTLLGGEKFRKPSLGRFVQRCGGGGGKKLSDAIQS